MKKRRAAEKTAPKVGVISLGCPKNLVDTETMLGQLLSQGYALTHRPEEADLLVVNTCGFIAEAEAESRQAIQEMAAVKAAHPGTKLVVTGCLAQRHGEALLRELPGIDLLLGTDQYTQMVPILARSARSETVVVNQVEPPAVTAREATPRLLTTPAHTAYVKIAEGCNNPCAFCVIPRLRGPYRSRRPEEIRREVEQLTQQGVREVILVSQDTTLYGRDLEPRTDLAALLESLAEISALAWIRLLYLYPTLINDRLLAVMAATTKVTPYLDLPLQHGHSAVLARMKRVEREETIRRLLERIRQRLPEGVIRTAFIVGFPGESEEEFRHLEALVAEAWFDHLGVFLYSDEEGTAACAMDNKIPRSVAEERRHRLMVLQQGISQRKLATWVGKTVPVLVEGHSAEEKHILLGRTAGQAPEIDGMVRITRGSARPGEIVPVKITGSDIYDLRGWIVAPER